MPYSESWFWLRLESELPPEEELPWDDLLPEPPAPVDFALLESVVLPSFLEEVDEVEEEPDLAFEDEDFEPEEEALLLSSLPDGDDEEEPDVEPMPEEFWLAPNPLVLPPLLLLLLLAVLPEEDVDPCAPDELPEEFIASLEF